MKPIETEFFNKSLEEREAKKREIFNRFFLWALGVRVIMLNDDNWEELTSKAFEEDLAVLIAFLTHKDYIDGSVAIATTYDEITQKMIVQGEGFNLEMGKVRNIIAKIFAPTILLTKKSRPDQFQEELACILSNLDENTAITLFPTGTRDLVAPIKAGIDHMIIDDMVIPLGIMLSDTKPIFASKQTFSDNFKSLLGRLFIDRKKSREFVLKMNGLNNIDYEKMSEGKEKGKRRRQNITGKFEVLRAYGVLKMFSLISDQYSEENPTLLLQGVLKMLVLINEQYPDEQPPLLLQGVLKMFLLIKDQYSDEVLHPLLQNEDNLPLIEQSYSLLSQGNNHLEWLFNNTTDSSNDTKPFLDREEVLSLLTFVNENAALEG